MDKRFNGVYYLCRYQIERRLAMKDKSRAILIAVIFILVAAAIILIAWGQKPAEDKAIKPPTEPIEIQTVKKEDF